MLVVFSVCVSVCIRKRERITQTFLSSSFGAATCDVMFRLNPPETVSLRAPPG